MPKKAPVPPRARREEHRRTIHDDLVIDPYHWMRDRDSKEVRDYLEAENSHCDAVMHDTAAFREELFQELVGRIKEDDSSVPYVDGRYQYFSRTEAGKQYRVYCRRPLDGKKTSEEILLDCNKLAGKHAFFQLGVFRVSPDDRILAYSMDIDGSEHFTLKFKNLDTGKHLEETIEGTSHSAAWDSSSNHLFYTVLDELVRPYQVRRHRLGSDVSDDLVVQEESDDKFFLYVGRSLSRQFLFFIARSNVTTECSFMRADAPDAKPVVFRTRKKNIRYFPAHHEDEFFLLTNDGAKDFEVIAVPVDAPKSKKVRMVVAHREGVFVDSIVAFERHLVLFERNKGLDAVRVIDLSSQEEHLVAMPDAVYSISEGTNVDYHSDKLRFIYSSPITPETVFDYHLQERNHETLKVREIPRGHDPSAYTTERHLVPSHDGTSVPLTLMYRKDVVLNGTAPGYLYGYGAYGLPVTPCFRSHWLSLLERGVVCAIAHVRGGGLLGEQWYEDGKLDKKKNTFLDFVACARHLMSQGYVSDERLATHGGSAGGLLIGAVLNMRPELFRVAIADVPFVDVINTMLDTTLPLTTQEFDEWGDPTEKMSYEYIKSYAPYEQIKRKRYPHLLVTTGLNDSRVQYWEPAKWVAKLRDFKKGSANILLKTNMGAGHGGASGRYDRLRETAFIYGYILEHLACI